MLFSATAIPSSRRTRASRRIAATPCSRVSLIYVLKFIEKLDFTINLPALEIFVSAPNVDRVKHIHAEAGK